MLTSIFRFLFVSLIKAKAYYICQLFLSHSTAYITSDLGAWPANELVVGRAKSDYDWEVSKVIININLIKSASAAKRAGTEREREKRMRRRRRQLQQRIGVTKQTTKLMIVLKLNERMKERQAEEEGERATFQYFK